MKLHIYIIIFIISFKNSYSQSKKSDNEIQETITWLNKKFLDFKAEQKIFLLNDVEYIEDEPFIKMIRIGPCGDESLTIRIPIKKIKPISFTKNHLKNTYQLRIETKNGEDINWYQSKDKSCGQIGPHMFFNLNESIENNDLINRIKKAFNQLMELYGNDGQEKF
jgi:hypothetical protein